MNQVIAISDTLYQQLAHNAEQHGFDSIEQLINHYALALWLKGIPLILWRLLGYYDYLYKQSMAFSLIRQRKFVKTGNDERNYRC